MPDQTGKNNATLASSGTGGTTGYSFVAGKVGNALALSVASNAYATLPVGILANSCEATVATWVYINNNPNWQRVWDFGNDTNVYMFLTTNSNASNHLKFAITISGNTHEEVINGPATNFPTAAWEHVAVVLGPSGGILYLNGAQVGTNSSMKLRPADLGSTTNNYIGRSQFPDPYLDGKIDEFQVYDRALSPQEVQALYAGS